MAVFFWGNKGEILFAGLVQLLHSLAPSSKPAVQILKISLLLMSASIIISFSDSPTSSPREFPNLKILKLVTYEKSFYHVRLTYSQVLEDEDRNVFGGTLFCILQLTKLVMDITCVTKNFLISNSAIK